MRLVVLAMAFASSFGVTAGPHDPVPTNAADFTTHDIAAALFKAKLGEPVDYSHHNLTYLDLAGLDFKGAKLAHSDLFGVDLTGANLRGADLSNTRLDRAVPIHADLAGANLSGAGRYNLALPTPESSEERIHPQTHAGISMRYSSRSMAGICICGAP